MSDVPHLQEQMLVNALLHEINGKASSVIDSFSGWLVGGFAATAALFVSQYESVSRHLGQFVLHRILITFFWILVIGILEKYIAVLIASASQSAAASRQIMEKMGEDSETIDTDFILSEIKRPIFPPIRWLVGRSFNKVKSGDLSSGARNFTRLAQIQGFLCLTQAALVLFAGFKIAVSFKA